MIYRDFQGLKLSLLGFGCMRFPMVNGSVDVRQVEEMTVYAIEHGVNYFDTAWPYHAGESESIIGKALSVYPREKWYLATKFPGHQIFSDGYNPASTFEKQLKKCGVEFFDFYLLHNVYENSLNTYLDPQWGILDYFIEQRKNGRIRHLGFSSHGGPELLEKFLDVAGEHMEFCQIQLNWLDWTLQDAKEKVRILNERRIPVWVMEPVRGGRLCHLSENDEKTLKNREPQKSIASWSFRFLEDIPGVNMILSGMSDMQQMKDNISVLEKEEPLPSIDRELLLEIAEGMKNSVPCTACRYCTEHCPQQLDIPALLAMYNELRFSPNFNLGMRMDAIPSEKQPAACIGCGSCAAICPQKIDIPGCMNAFSDALAAMPSWAEICRQREEAQKTNKEHN